MNLTKNHLGVLCLTILMGFLALISSAEAQSGFHLDLQSQRVSWSQLSFHAKNFWVEVSTEIQIRFLQTSELDALLLASPRGIPIKLKNSQASELTTNTVINPRFRTPVKIHNRTWFDPTDASALGCVRLRRGEDDFKKMYRFTEQGVFRRRIEPKDKREASLEPDKWKDIKDTFYPYNAKQLNCPLVSERSLLIYLLAAAPISKINDPVSLCVWGKRQLHRVTVQREGTYPVSVASIIKRQQDELGKEERVSAVKIALKAEPIESDLKAVENFSFLGLQQDISIYIDPTTQLPIQVSGIIPTLGKAELKLNEIKWASKSD